MKQPTIHINGTSANALFEEVLEILHSTRESKQLVERMTVHGRDFYPQGEGAIMDAIDAKIALLTKYDVIIKELTEYGEYLSKFIKG